MTITFDVLDRLKKSFADSTDNEQYAEFKYKMAALLPQNCNLLN